MIKCPFCAEHGAMSREAIENIASAIEVYLRDCMFCSHEVQGELLNLANQLRGHLEREEEPDGTKLSLEPVCPTPQKRKYSNLEHAAHDAAKWHQHPYLCACTYVHLSKLAPGQFVDKVNAPGASADEFPDMTLEDFLK
jgi:hypothetical protein